MRVQSQHFTLFSSLFRINLKLLTLSKLRLKMFAPGFAVLVWISVLVLEGAPGSSLAQKSDNSPEERVQKRCSFRVISWGQERTFVGTCEKNGCCASLSPNNKDTEKTCLGFCTKPTPSGNCPEKCKNTGIKSAYKFDLEAEAENGRCFPVGSGCSCGVRYPDLDMIPQTVCFPPKVPPHQK